MCKYWFAELSRASLTKQHKTKKYELFKTRNDNYIVVDGRTILRGRSPFEGVWHDTHTPYDIYGVKVKLFNKIHINIKYYFYIKFL